MKTPSSTMSVALDMSNTFDTVNIRILIDKLIHTNIPNIITKSIANYIKRRQTYTTYRNTTFTQCQLYLDSIHARTNANNLLPNSVKTILILQNII